MSVVSQQGESQQGHDGVQLVFRELSYDVKLTIPSTKRIPCAPPYTAEYQNKRILNCVSGAIRPGRLTCILGASGAGKTSLLNILSGSLVSGALSGQLVSTRRCCDLNSAAHALQLVNGNVVDGGFITKMSGYVHQVNTIVSSRARSLHHNMCVSSFAVQDDVMMATQTVREALTMAAALKMNFSSDERVSKVNDMLALLGLSGSENTIIGDASMKGVSGGERKRVAVGMQLISNPSLLFLDEPTSGLDTLNAYNVVATLKTLARKGKTVVATLHQPSSEIFHMIDDLIVMAAGELVYCGPAGSAVEYFGSLGFACPKYSNPGDFIFMQVLNLQKQAETAMKRDGGGGGSVLEVTNQQIELSKQWGCSPQNQEMLGACSHLAVSPISNISTNFQAAFVTQFAILMQRAWKNALRNPLLVKAKIGQAMFMAVLLGLIYQGDAMKQHQAGIQNRTGVIFFMSINQVMSSAIGILSVFFAEKLVFMREHASGM